jgi:hypothetical protein
MERQLSCTKSVTMEYFIETSNLDASTTAMLKKYDKDGDGSFSKDEVVAIILDLRDSMRSNENLEVYNKLFKRLLFVALGFCVLMLASMFGLSYGVAALTAKTEVNSGGALVATGSHNAVSTNSRAEAHVVNMNADGKYCVTLDEAEIMRMEVATGRNVMLDQTDLDGTGKATLISGSGTYDDGDSVCFGLSGGTSVCVTPSDECNEDNSFGRRLSDDEHSRLGLSGRRRLPNCCGSIGGFT